MHNPPRSRFRSRRKACTSQIVQINPAMEDAVATTGMIQYTMSTAEDF
jgi:hypothetical protein